MPSSCVSALRSAVGGVSVASTTRLSAPKGGVTTDPLGETPFFAAYEADFPLRPGYFELRRPIYQLYYQLVHVNLFGRGYVAGTLGSLEAAEAAA